MARKGISQKRFVETAEKKIKAGKAPDAAVKEAAAEAFGSETSLAVNSPIVREELGLDAEETRGRFGKAMVTQFDMSMAGTFPAWIEAVEDLAAKAKLKLDYLKTFKDTLQTALVTKTERKIIETDDTKGRTDDEIRFRLEHGKWPEEMTIDARKVN
jgi:tRNA A37 threonylcarbamoyltransferase TsaD